MPKPARRDSNSPRDIFSSGNYGAAFPVCLRAAENGEFDSALLVGWMYLTGNGVEENIDDAMTWLRRAADGSDPLAAFYLGNAYESSGDARNAVICYSQSAARDFSPAFYRLGELYVAGRGVTRNAARAYALYERAMGGGHLFGRAKVANFLIRGHKGGMG